MEPQHVDPKQIVADGYDRIAEQYCAWARQVRQEERAKYTAVLLKKLPVGATVLELGCRAGLPTTRQLAERFAVTGVDSVRPAGRPRAAQCACGHISPCRHDATGLCPHKL